MAFFLITNAHTFAINSVCAEKIDCFFNALCETFSAHAYIFTHTHTQTYILAETPRQAFTLFHGNRVSQDLHVFAYPAQTQNRACSLIKRRFRLFRRQHTVSEILDDDFLRDSLPDLSEKRVGSRRIRDRRCRVSLVGGGRRRTFTGVSFEAQLQKISFRRSGNTCRCETMFSYDVIGSSLRRVLESIYKSSLRNEQPIKHSVSYAHNCTPHNLRICT